MQLKHASAQHILDMLDSDRSTRRHWLEAKAFRLSKVAPDWRFKGSAPQLTQAANIAAILNDFVADADEGESPSNNSKKDGDKGDDKDKDEDDGDALISRWVTAKVQGVQVGYPKDSKIVFSTDENALRAAVGLLRWGKKTKRPVWSECAVQLAMLVSTHPGFDAVYSPRSHQWTGGTADDLAATACAAIDFMAESGPDAGLQRLVNKAAKSAENSDQASGWQSFLLAKLNHVRRSDHHTDLGGKIASVFANLERGTNDDLMRACESLAGLQDTDSTTSTLVDAYGAFPEPGKRYSTLTPLAGLALLRSGIKLDRKDYAERGVAALRCGFGLMKANALFGDSRMNEATIPVSRMFHGLTMDDELIQPKSWAADEGGFLAAWAEADKYCGSAYQGPNWRLGIDGIGAEDDSWTHLLSHTASNFEGVIRGTVTDAKGNKTTLEVEPPPPFIREIQVEQDGARLKFTAIPSRAVSTDTPPTGAFSFGEILLNHIPATVGPKGFECETEGRMIKRAFFDGQVAGIKVHGDEQISFQPQNWTPHGQIAVAAAVDGDWYSTRMVGAKATGSIESDAFWATNQAWEADTQSTRGAKLQVMNADSRQLLKEIRIPAGQGLVKLNFMDFNGNPIYLAFRDTDRKGWLKFKPRSG